MKRDLVCYYFNEMKNKTDHKILIQKSNVSTGQLLPSCVRDIISFRYSHSHDIQRISSVYCLIC